MHIISLRGPIGFKVRADEIKTQLEDAKGKPIRVEINSPGGFVFEGLDIFNLIRDYKGHTTTVLMSLAASMGSYIALAGDKVIAHDNAVFMIHNASGGVIGNHIHMRKAADNIEGLSVMLAQEYVRKTGKSIEEIRRMMDEETFLFGDEILKAGFVDEIIETKPEDKKHSKDKATAISEARAQIQHCLGMMKESEEAGQDLEKVAAFLDLYGPGHEGNSGGNSATEMTKDFDPEMPFPNEHACRVRQPGEFQDGSFRRISRKADGRTLDIIIGRLKGKTTTTTQAFRYPRDEWSVTQAREHCKRNNGILFEPAGSAGGSAKGCCGNDNPAGAGNKNEEDNIMKLSDLLAQNPEARREYEDEITKARTEGREAAEKAFQDRVDRTSPIIISSYPEPIKALAAKALKGETSVDAMDAAVASFDSTAEGIALKAAAEEQKGQKETPAQEQKVGGQDDGSIDGEDDFQAEMSRMDEALGKGKEDK